MLKLPQGAVLLALLPGLSGCYHDVRRLYARDMRCNIDLTSIRKIGKSVFEAQGCGPIVAYDCSRHGCPAEPSRVRERLVVVTAEHEREHDSPPDVTENPQLRALGATIRRVAIAPPTRCSPMPAADVSGAGQGAHSVARTECGVALDELQRVLTRSGYEVVALPPDNSAVDVRVHAPPTSEVDVRVRPQQALQASPPLDLVFRVNALEFIAAATPSAQTTKYRYFDGSSRQELVLSEEERAEIHRALLHVPHGSIGAAVLSVTAIDPKSGVALWMFEQRATACDTTTSMSVAAVEQLSVVASENRRAVHRREWVPTSPPPGFDSVRNCTSYAGESEATSPKQLLRRLADDFAQAFKASSMPPAK